MYCRWESGIHPRESLTDLMVASKDHINSLEDHIRLLQKRIKSVESKLASFSNSASLNGNSNPDNAPDNRLSYKKKNSYDEVELYFTIISFWYRLQLTLSPSPCYGHIQMNLKLQKKIEYDPLMVTSSFGVKGGDPGTTVTNSYLSQDENHSYQHQAPRRASSEEVSGTDTLTEELQSVALDWKSMRGVKECVELSCMAPLEFATRKVTHSLLNLGRFV